MAVEVVVMTKQQEAPATRSRADGRGARHVVVAYDGSTASLRAVTWAAVEAGAMNARLTVLSAGPAWTEGFAAPILDEVAAAGRRLAREGVDWVGQMQGGVGTGPVEALAVMEDPATALVRASRGADLLVLGSRGRGRVAGALLGSVAFAVTSRAECPVVVVRGEVERRPGPDAPVVVGVDDSHGADEAVVFAADVAERWGAPLVVVAAWTVPDITVVDGYSAVDVTPLVEWARRSAGTSADVAVDLARSDRPGLQGVTRVVQQRPAQALSDASAEAGLVVVGARGRGGLGSLFLGSVSHAVIHQADCPVAVVRRHDAP